MPQIEMLHPATLREAVAALSRRGAVPLAGGTDLIPAMGKGEVAPTALVNLKRLPGLVGVGRVRGGVRIGALTTVTDLLHSPLVKRDASLLFEVSRGFASVQIRNVATIGGNLCNAAPSADLALPLLALDARLEIRGPVGARQLEIADFFRGVNKTALRRGEVLTGIIIPAPWTRARAAHAKLGVRQAMDLAFVGVAAAAQLSAGGRRCRAIRIALGSVAPIPMRARKAEAVLEGETVSDELIAEAAAAAARESRPVSDLRASKEYRRQMTEVLTRRVLQEALQGPNKER